MDKTISDLKEATSVLDDDLYVLEQGGEAKKLKWFTFIKFAVARLNGHGGIQSIAKLSTSGLADKYRITLADAKTFDFVVTNGRSITKISKTSTNGHEDTYTISYNNSTTSTFKVTNGAKGAKGDNAYIWIKYASLKPTKDSHSMGDEPDNWIGIYSGNATSAPSDWDQYKWFQIKGEKGDTGNPATLVTQSVTYQVSDSGTIIPSGEWGNSIPVVPQGKYLWTKTELKFNTGGLIASYSVTRMGLDGTGSVSSVNNISPNDAGNVSLTADDVGALPSSGGVMTGGIEMNGQPISGLNDPEKDTDAARKAYVDKRVSKTGDTMTGSLILDKGTSFSGFVNRRTVNDIVYALYAYVNTSGAARIERRESESTDNYLSLDASKTTLGKPLALGSGGTGATTATDAMANLGKVSGTYTGTSDATRRDINTGGTGNLLLIYNWKNNLFAIVTPRGAFERSGDSVLGIGSSECSYTNGNLRLTTVNTCLNASDVTYNYVCI